MLEYLPQPRRAVWIYRKSFKWYFGDTWWLFCGIFSKTLRFRSKWLLSPKKDIRKTLLSVVSLVISSHISIDNFRGQIDRAVRKMNKTTFPYDKLSSTSILTCFKTYCTFLIIEEYFPTVKHSSTSMYYIWSVELLRELKSLGEKVLKLLSLFQVNHKLF